MSADSSAVIERSFVLIAAAPMLAAFGLLGVRLQTLPLRFGRWSRPCRALGSGPGSTWNRSLVRALGVMAILALLLQLSNGFPLASFDALQTLLLVVIPLALVNAIAEETLFRGLLQRPLVDTLGVTRGIWAQAASFGIHHWGASPSLIAGLAMVPFLARLGWLRGRATHETGGLGWSVAVHAALGVAYFGATS